MGTFWDTLLAVGCVLGLAFVGWWLFGLLLRPLPGGGAKVVIPGRGDGKDLEQQLRSFLWLRGMGLLSCPLIVADVDLTPAGWELALHLAARWPEVILWPASDLGEYISRV